MANNNYISRSKFQEGSTLQLRNLGICIAITNIIDNIIKEELPDYDGCVSGETFNTIYEYNKKYMYEREQERKREENA